MQIQHNQCGGDSTEDDFACLSLSLYTLSNPMHVCSDLHEVKRMVVILQ